MGNIFDDISSGENAALDDEYRCLFVVNTNTTYSLQNTKLWLQSESVGAPTHELGVDPAAASDLDSASAQAAEIADEDTAPAGVSFSRPLTRETALSLGTIGPGQCKAFWVKRTAIASGEVVDATFQIRVEGESS